MMRGRDATESSDQRDARPDSPSAALPFADCSSTVMASPGVTTSASATTVVSLMGEGSSVLATENEGDGMVASSARRRNCGEDADVDSTGSAGLCLRLGLELIGMEPVGATVALLLRPRPIGRGRGRSLTSSSSSVTYTPALFSVSLSRSSRRESVDEMEG